MYRQEFFTFLNKKKLHKKFPEDSDCLPEDGGRRSKSAPAYVVLIMLLSTALLKFRLYHVWHNRNRLLLLLLTSSSRSSSSSSRRRRGTGIRGLMRGMATLPKGNQELLVVKDKVGRSQVSLG